MPAVFVEILPLLVAMPAMFVAMFAALVPISPVFVAMFPLLVAMPAVFVEILPLLVAMPAVFVAMFAALVPIFAVFVPMFPLLVVMPAVFVAMSAVLVPIFAVFVAMLVVLSPIFVVFVAMLVALASISMRLSATSCDWSNRSKPAPSTPAGGLTVSDVVASIVGAVSPVFTTKSPRAMISRSVPSGVTIAPFMKVMPAFISLLPSVRRNGASTTEPTRACRRARLSIAAWSKAGSVES